MHNQLKYSSLLIKLVISILFLAGWMALAGCNGNYGRLVINQDVKYMFEKSIVLEDHNYYHSGPANEPKVVVGLMEDYTLPSEYWTPVDLTPELLERWIRRQTYHLGYVLDDAGAKILDEEGRQIGVLYMIEYPHKYAGIQTNNEKEVSIVLPIPRRDPFLLSPFDRDLDEY